ncbi:MAG: efflux RND transporter periplasmic adaptor subunit [Thermoguttaceae bacterium]
MVRALGRLMLPVVLLATIIAAVGAAVVQVRRRQQELAQAPKFAVGPVPVHVVAARSGTIRETRSYLAVVEPVRTAEVAARLTAEVLSISCDEGYVVRAGDVMAQLDSREIRAAIAGAEAQIAQAREDRQAAQALVETLAASVDYWRQQLARDQSLRTHSAAAISMTEVETTAEKLQSKQGELEAARYRLKAIQHSIEAAEEKVRELTTRLAYCSVVSPFDGVVTKRMVDEGDLAVPGKVLFLVEDRSALRLAFDVPQEDLMDVQPGMEVSFAVAGETRRATLTRLHPSLNAVRMLRAEVDLPAEAARGVVSGSYVPLEVVLRVVREAPILPVSALVGTGDAPPQVYAVRDGRLALVRVQVLATRQNEMAVSGITTGETVVVHPFLGWARYHDGQKVEVIP